jgi:hypothetical protein
MKYKTQKLHYCKENNPFYGKHHTKEDKNIMSNLKKGIYLGTNNPNWKGGKPKCKICKKQLQYYGNKYCFECFHTIIISKMIKNHIVSLKTRNKIKNSYYHRHLKGKSNPNYKDGKTALIAKIRQLDKYVQWRNSVYVRDKYTCQICGKVGTRLNAHHKILLTSIMRMFNIKSISQALRIKVIWNINWGITLCSKCHRYVDA